MGINVFNGISGKVPANNAMHSGVNEAAKAESGISVSAGSGPADRTALDILRSLSNGESFTATITDIHSGTVTITLDGGQSFTANLLNHTVYNIGDRAGFLIQDNQGEDIVLKALPVPETAFETKMISQSLKEAGIFSSDRNREMVLELMRNNMSISKEALLDMVKELTAHSDTPVKDIVALKRMGMEITPENIKAYDNYKTYNGAVQEDIGRLAESIKNAVTDGKTLSELVDALSDKDILEGSALKSNGAEEPDASGNSIRGKEEAEYETASVQKEASAYGENAAAVKGQGTAKAAMLMTPAEQELTKKLLQSFDRMLQNHNAAMGREGAAALKLPGGLKNAATLSEFMSELARAAESFEKEPLLGNRIKSLLSGSTVKALVEALVKDCFSLDSSRLTEEGAIKENIARNINRLSQLSSYAAQSGNTAVGDAASNLSNNLDFLNQMNQFVTAAQIPLKAIGEKGEGELYVYRRRGGKGGGDDTLKAFLHLDMEHLGRLDIYVTLSGRKVSTNFKVEDVSVLDFLEENMKLLTERLKDEGYDVSTTVADIGSEGGFNFVKEALLPELPVNEVKRFRFDVKA